MAGPDAEVSIWVYRTSACLLVLLALLAGLTGARTCGLVQDLPDVADLLSRVGWGVERALEGPRLHDDVNHWLA